jgi:hypothetical protein
MKNIKTYKEFKEPTVSWEELAKDFREDKRSDKDSLAANPFDAKDIKEIHPANMVVKDDKKKEL